MPATIFFKHSHLGYSEIFVNDHGKLIDLDVLGGKLKHSFVECNFLSDWDRLDVEEVWWDKHFKKSLEVWCGKPVTSKEVNFLFVVLFDAFLWCFPLRADHIVEEFLKTLQFQRKNDLLEFRLRLRTKLMQIFDNLIVVLLRLWVGLAKLLKNMSIESMRLTNSALSKEWSGQNHTFGSVGIWCFHRWKVFQWFSFFIQELRVSSLVVFLFSSYGFSDWGGGLQVGKDVLCLRSEESVDQNVCGLIDKHVVELVVKFLSPLLFDLIFSFVHESLDQVSVDWGAPGLIRAKELPVLGTENYDRFGGGVGLWIKHAPKLFNSL